MQQPRDDVQRWAVRSLSTFFDKELPAMRGAKVEDAVAVEIKEQTAKQTNDDPFDLFD